MERALRDYGFQQHGYTRMMSGYTGKMMEAPVFAGPCYFQALRHNVKDKYQARQCGGVNPKSRVPVGGRKLGGGLRFGEMERDNAISHGATKFLQERLRDAADRYETSYCKTCGTIANALNLKDDDNKFTCRLCGNKGNFGRVTIPYAFKYLSQVANGLGFFIKFELKTKEELLEEQEATNAMANQAAAKDNKRDEEIEDKDYEEFVEKEGEESEKEEESGSEYSEEEAPEEYAIEEEED